MGNVNQQCIRSLLCTPIKNGKKNKVIGKAFSLTSTLHLYKKNIYSQKLLSSINLKTKIWKKDENWNDKEFLTNFTLINVNKYLLNILLNMIYFCTYNPVSTEVLFKNDMLKVSRLRDIKLIIYIVLEPHIVVYNFSFLNDVV